MLPWPGNNGLRSPAACVAPWLQAPELQLEPRGLIEVKGKGSMFTYWVSGPVPAVLPGPSSPAASKPGAKAGTASSTTASTAPGATSPAGHAQLASGSGVLQRPADATLTFVSHVPAVLPGPSSPAASGSGVLQRSADASLTFVSQVLRHRCLSPERLGSC